MAKRRKSEVLPAAQSREEAIQLLARYSALAGQIARNDQITADRIAAIHVETDTFNAPLVAEQERIFLAIKPWWAVAGATVTEGDRKTAELGGCLLGHRIGNPTLKYPAPEPVAVQLLSTAGWKGLLRIKMELDKPAIMAAIRWLSAPAGADRGNDQEIDITAAADWFRSVGFKITQKEEFFIDRLPASSSIGGAATETVTDPAATQPQQVAA